MRQPSLHIKESDLTIVLQEVFKKLPFKGPYDEISMLIVKESRKYSAVSRSIKISNDKVEKKVNKMKLAGLSDTAIFAQTLLFVRQQMKHRGLHLIKVGDPDWLNLKESCKLATDFCNEFQLELKRGYKEYITLGLKKMKNFSIFKFKNLHSSICNEYEAIQVINQDKTPGLTRECHDIYLANISEKTGYSQGYQDFPEKYKYFVEAKEEAKKFGVSCKIYIAAQFQGFEWNNSVPDPAQLVGLKAIDRLQKYAYEHSIQLGQKRNVVNFKAIKNGNHNSK